MSIIYIQLIADNSIGIKFQQKLQTHIFFHMIFLSIIIVVIGGGGCYTSRCNKLELLFYIINYRQNFYFITNIIKYQSSSSTLFRPKNKFPVCNAVLLSCKKLLDQNESKTIQHISELRGQPTWVTEPRTVVSSSRTVARIGHRGPVQLPTSVASAAPPYGFWFCFLKSGRISVGNPWSV